MNTTLVNVNKNTTDSKVLAITEKLIANRNNRLNITFIKKNGEKRSMVCVVKNGYNDIMGFKTTSVGRSIVASKCAKDMIVVSEFYTPEGVVGAPDCVRPRTINLRKVISVDVLP